MNSLPSWSPYDSVTFWMRCNISTLLPGFKTFRLKAPDKCVHADFHTIIAAFTLHILKMYVSCSNHNKTDTKNCAAFRANCKRLPKDQVKYKIKLNVSRQLTKH